MNQHSTHWCGSWRRVACFRQSISARVVLDGIHLAITASPAPSTHISHRLSVVTPVRTIYPLFSTSHINPMPQLPLDVLAHRQLSAAIGYTSLHASLHSKPHVERVLDVVNRRHRMAQMAGRASVEFYVGLALKGRNEREAKKADVGKAPEVTEEAFVIRTFRNGVGVFVSK